jgi:hypothetical protein
MATSRWHLVSSTRGLKLVVSLSAAIHQLLLSMEVLVPPRPRKPLALCRSSTTLHLLRPKLIQCRLSTKLPVQLTPLLPLCDVSSTRTRVRKFYNSECCGAKNKDGMLGTKVLA